MSGGWPEKIADAARDGAKAAIARGALEAVYIPDRVYSATLDAALRVEQSFQLQVSKPTAGRARASAPETSRAAALNVTPRTGTQRRKVLDFLVAVGNHGATRDEIAAALHMSPNTVRPRVSELLEGHFIAVREGVTRPSATGDPAEVLVATEKARGGRLNSAVAHDSSRELSPAGPAGAAGAGDALFADRGASPPRSPYDPEV